MVSSKSVYMYNLLLNVDIKFMYLRMFSMKNAIQAHAFTIYLQLSDLAKSIHCIEMVSLQIYF